MAQIEQSACACGLAFILGNDACLGFYALAHRIGQRLALTRQDLGAIGLAPLEKVKIAQNSVFDHFGIASAQLARWQGGQSVQIGQNKAGLVECADKVLARCGVDRSLAAN